MSTSIQEQDLIQKIKKLEQRLEDLERGQKSVIINAINNGNVAVYKKITSSLTEEIGMSYNSFNYTRSGTPPDTQNVDINFNANGFWLDYFNDASSALGWFRLSDKLDLRLDAHDVNIPATSTSTGTKGTIKWNSTHLFVCTATNTWRRVALSAF
ncbi:MAG: hypothetical protein ACO3TG_00365 [Minisyncoccia bacterium]|jgi:hypothetical protein